MRGTASFVKEAVLRSFTLKCGRPSRRPSRLAARNCRSHISGTRMLRVEVRRCRLHQGLWNMSRITPFASPLLLGFDAMEKTLERISKASDGYPPYNIERIAAGHDAPERLRITLAVAGFSEEELDVSTEENQLLIRGRQID